MPKPPSPVLLAEAKCDKNGILVEWMVAGNSDAISHTISWKAESWWQSKSATILPGESDYQITDLPPNEKVKVWMHSTNASGSGPYSNQVGYVTTRDCCIKGEAEPDYVFEFPMTTEYIMSTLYTRPYQAFLNANGSMGKIEVIGGDDAAGTCISKCAPAVDPKLKASVEGFFGPFDLNFEEHVQKDMDNNVIHFQIKNFSMVGDYVETAEGVVKVESLSDTSSRVSTNFDFRLKNVPMFGFYLSQLVRRGFADGSKAMEVNLTNFKDSQGQ